MRLEFEPNASALPLVESEVANQTVSSEVDKLLRDGVKAAQEGNRAEARNLLLRVTEADNDNENAWLWLASISEYPEELLVFLNNVLRINANNGRALEWHHATESLLAKTLVQRGVDAVNDQRADYARQCFEQAIEHEVGNEMAWLWLASIADDDDERASLFEKVLELNPENETAKASLEAMTSRKNQTLFQEALSAAFDGNHIFALEALEVVLRRDADFEDALVLKAHIAGSFEERAESYLKLRSINPDNEMARANLASWRNLADKLERETEPATAVVETLEETVEAAPEELVAEESYVAETEETPEQETAAVQFEEEAVAAEMEDSDEVELELAEPMAETVAEAVTEDEPAADENRYLSDEEIHSEAYAHPELPTGELDPAVEAAAHEAVEESAVTETVEEELNEPASVEFDMPEMPAALTQAAQPQSEEAEMHLAFIDSDDDEEAEAFFRNLTEVTDVPRPQPVEEVAPEPAQEVAAPIQEEVSEVSESDDSSVAVSAQPDVFDPVEAAVETVTAAEPVAATGFLHAKAEVTLCPFCNAENDKQAFVCASCQTVLTLSDLEMLLNQQDADAEKLRSAVESLERENESYGLNADQLMHLGVGHVNLKNYRQGFYFLQESVRMNPSNVILDAQVNALAIRLSEIEEQTKVHDAMAKNCKILVVDDSPTVRKLISGKLEKCGHEVICAVDGVDALAKIDELLPDLILLDITMPRMDGYQVCKMIRSNETTKDVPVVMISGKDGFFDKVRGKMAGTTGYITKPFGPETLMKTVETYLN